MNKDCKNCEQNPKECKERTCACHNFGITKAVEEFAKLYPFHRAEFSKDWLTKTLQDIDKKAREDIKENIELMLKDTPSMSLDTYFRGSTIFDSLKEDKEV